MSATSNPRPGKLWTDPETDRVYECWERGPMAVDHWGGTSGPTTYWLVPIDPAPNELAVFLAKITKGKLLNRAASLRDIPVAA
jgi:hypothetical protein